MKKDEINGITRIIKVVESASRSLTCSGIYSEAKHIEEIIFISTRCEIIPGMYVYF
jgi:hypothetical protein